MNIVIIHGQSHKGMTYTLAHAVLGHLTHTENEVREFFLPQDGPDFCVGCNTCFLKGEAHCPASFKVQPIAQAMERADLIFLTSPTYVMEMSGALKNLLDHLAYRWVTHRPHGTMFRKVGVTISASAGAPAGGVTKSMARQLKWMGCPKVFQFPFVSHAMTKADLIPKKQAEMERRAEKIAKSIEKRVQHPRASLRGKLFFFIFRKMQSAPDAAWNPTDRDWWHTHGWTGHARPWNDQVN